MSESKYRLVALMTRNDKRRVAEEAARLMVSGAETEYLDAKERAIMMLGLSSQSARPSNKRIKECISRLTRDRLGADEVDRRIKEMRAIALDLMEAVSDYDPFLIGSVLSGSIRESSDIDLHAYCDEHEILVNELSLSGYCDISEEVVHNLKGEFVHLRFDVSGYPVEVTVYPWSWRDLVPTSSITGKPMERLDLKGVRRLVNSGHVRSG